MTSLIMVVDDDEGMLRLLRLKLEICGYTVVSFSDAEEALELLEQVTPDLFILDFMMPGMNGLELCERIRARDSTSQVPVMMLTAQEELLQRSAWMKAGVNICVSKTKLNTHFKQQIEVLLTVESANAGR